MIDLSNPYIAILLVALIAYFMRIIGVELMVFATITPRVKLFLKSMAISVIVAIVVSILAQSGMRELLAVLAAGVVMLATNKAVYGIIASMVVASAWYWLV